MALLEFLEGLYDLYLIFIASPGAIVRWLRRRFRPTPHERALSARPEMRRFSRGAWLSCIAWIAVSVAAGIGAGSPGAGAIMAVLGFMFIPSMIERRYERLVERLSTAPSK